MLYVKLNRKTKVQDMQTNSLKNASLNIGNAVLPSALSVDEIMKLRNQLPDSWKWHKCYELPYVDSKPGKEFSLKHWALTAPDCKGPVCSLGLISHDHHTETYNKFLDNDLPVEWVEKSLLIVDSLLAEIERMKGLR
jgi:hypothetical protein